MVGHILVSWTWSLFCCLYLQVTLWCSLLTWRGMWGGMPCASLYLGEAMCLTGRSVGASLRVTACRSGLTGRVALTRHRQPCTRSRFAKTSEWSRITLLLRWGERLLLGVKEVLQCVGFGLMLHFESSWLVFLFGDSLNNFVYAIAPF